MWLLFYWPTKFGNSNSSSINESCKLHIHLVLVVSYSQVVIQKWVTLKKSDLLLCFIFVFTFLYRSFTRSENINAKAKDRNTFRRQLYPDGKVKKYIWTLTYRNHFF